MTTTLIQCVAPSLRACHVAADGTSQVEKFLFWSSAVHTHTPTSNMSHVRGTHDVLMSENHLSLRVHAVICTCTLTYTNTDGAPKANSSPERRAANAPARLQPSQPLALRRRSLPINFPCQYLLSSASAVSSAAFAVLSFLTVNLISHISRFNYIKWKEVAISSRSN